MAVITVSRQYGSGGREIAVAVCERLGYRYFDKDLMARVSTEVGLSEQEIVDFSEDEHKVRGILDRLFTGRPREVVTSTHMWTETTDGVRGQEYVELDPVKRISLVQAVVKAAYRRGNVVIVGRGGQVILKDMSDVLHVRVTAPLEQRIRRVQERDEISREAAQALIAKKDAAAADYLKRFYQMDAANTELYHMMINTGKLNLERAAEIVALAASNMPEAVLS